MTAILNVLVAGGSGVQNGTLTLADSVAGASAIASCQFNADGTITYVGSGSSGPARWYFGGAAPTHYCTYTVNSGLTPTFGYAALTPTTSTCLTQWNNGTVGTQTSNTTVRIYSDAAGANLAGTFQVNVTVTRTS